MKKLSLVFALGALAPVLAAGCATTGQATGTGARTDACTSTTVRNVAPGDARGARTAVASVPVRNPDPQAARGGSSENRRDNRVVADSLAAAGRGSEIASCLTGLAHAGQGAGAPAF
jgi:hypothetical protein